MFLKLKSVSSPRDSTNLSTYTSSAITGANNNSNNAITSSSTTTTSSTNVNNNAHKHNFSSNSYHPTVITITHPNNNLTTTYNVNNNNNSILSSSSIPPRKKKSKKKGSSRNKQQQQHKYFSEDGNQVLKVLEFPKNTTTRKHRASSSVGITSSKPSIKPNNNRSTLEIQPNDLNLIEYDEEQEVETDEEEEYEMVPGDLPDEIFINIFSYLPVLYLTRDIQLVCKRFAILWVRGVQVVEVVGPLRKLKEDQFVTFVRKFTQLEKLDLMNSGSSEDFQITDKGLLQLAHKYIYSNADYLAVPNNYYKTPNVGAVGSVIDPLSGNFDLNFDFESHLDSMDDELSSLSDHLYSLNSNENLSTSDNSISIIDDDELSTSVIHNNVNIKDNHHSKLIMNSQNRKVMISNLPINSPYNLLYYTHIYQRSYGGLPKKNSSGNPFEDPLYGLRTLETLNFQGCHYITENGVKYLTYICQNLKHLNLRGCTKVNDQAMSYISQFNNLEYLDITGCVHISNVGIKYLSNSNSKLKLKYLDLTFCHQITDEGLKYLSELRVIEDLTLQCCRFITSQGLTYLVENCKQLKSLNLTGCHLFDLSGITNNENIELIGLPYLEKLNVMGCKLTNDKCLQKLVEWNCKNLKELVLAFSDLITDDGVILIIKYCKFLTHLNLKRCIQLTDKILFEIKNDLKFIKYLNLTGLRGITNLGCSYLKNCIYLKELILNRCTNIDDEGLNFLYTCIALEKLDISECLLITDDGVRTLCSFLCNRKFIKKMMMNQFNQQQDDQSTTLINNINITKEKDLGLKELTIEKCKLSKELISDLIQYYGLKIIQ
ncbi:hypothetical protein ABK040_008267 [Willaertia magna]